MKVVFIVEGTNDADRVKEALPGCSTIVTHGTRFSRRVKMEVEGFQQLGYRIFVLTDPDGAGDHIAKPFICCYGLKRVPIDPEQARKMVKRRYSGQIHWKYGIEYCDTTYLHDVLTRFLEEDMK